jgi:thiamine pyrophosphate-dependent acetolactate synthase large subunit-like protein/rubredoxin
MVRYKCQICSYVYDENKEDKQWDNLPDSWVCPVCQAPPSAFQLLDEATENMKNKFSSHKSESPITISDLMIETMIKWGVTHVFGMVGHSNLGLAEAIRKQCDKGQLTFIGIRHEGSASFAASAYAKLCGRPASCLSIAGPGATNLLTGLWDAKLDRVPVLALTGQVDLQFLGPGSFQEINLSSAFEPVSCFSQTVLEQSNHAELINLALKHAILKRDVAHLIFPNQIQEIPISQKIETVEPSKRIPSLTISPSKASIEQAIAMFRDAKKPVIIVGYGSKGSIKTIIRFAESFNLPVLTTFKAKGMISDNHPLACGVLGLSGTPISSHFMSQSDLLIVLGASFSKHTGIMKDKPIIQIDYDPMTLGKFHNVSLPILGEIDTTVNILSHALKNDLPKIDQSEILSDLWNKWRQEKINRETKYQENGLPSASVFASMTRFVPKNAVISVDVGDNTYSFGRYFECQEQSILMSGYLGSIGFGYPAAIGAWAAAPNRPIFCVTGDGGFAQYMCEVTTAVKYGIPIKHILLNNSQLGKITKEQRSSKKTVWATDLHNPNFSKYANNCGALGIRIEKLSQLDPGFETFVRHDGPAMLEIITDPELT